MPIDLRFAPDEAPLLTDLYELTMAASYFALGLAPAHERELTGNNEACLTPVEAGTEDAMRRAFWALMVCAGRFDYGRATGCGTGLSILHQGL